MPWSFIALNALATFFATRLAIFAGDALAKGPAPEKKTCPDTTCS